MGQLRLPVLPRLAAAPAGARLLGPAPGLAYLPLAAATIAATQLAGLVGACPPGLVVTAGAAGIALGSLLLGLAEPGDNFATGLLPGLLLAGAGNGLALVALQVAILTEVAQQEAGVVAGLFTTAQEVASAVGTAALVAMAATRMDPAAGIRIALTVGAAVALAGGLIGGPFLSTTRQAPPDQSSSGPSRLGR